MNGFTSGVMNGFTSGVMNGFTTAKSVGLQVAIAGEIIVDVSRGLDPNGDLLYRSRRGPETDNTIGQIPRTERRMGPRPVPSVVTAE